VWRARGTPGFRRDRLTRRFHEPDEQLWVLINERTAQTSVQEVLIRVIVTAEFSPELIPIRRRNGSASTIACRKMASAYSYQGVT
jgi:hypothetical protein